MTILADPAYMKNDTTKLALNTYRKRDANFTGMVLYFTPKGQFSVPQTPLQIKIITT
jgi:hypothetical protein